MPKSNSATIQPRIRVLRGSDIALGPGKVELLEQVRDSGSIAEAANRLGMSYMRAWTLIKTMERCFAEPLVAVSRGGAAHGGAKLTINGIRVVKLYRAMETKSLTSTVGLRKQLVGLLRT